jgi:hypothetical protein
MKLCLGVNGYFVLQCVGDLEKLGVHLKLNLNPMKEILVYTNVVQLYFLPRYVPNTDIGHMML